MVIMSVINSYKPPVLQRVTSTLSDGPYDLNSNIPIPPSLETKRVKLVPFLPANHAEAFFAAYSAAPALECYLFTALPDFPSLLTVLEEYRTKPDAIFFAILDKTKGTSLEKSMAGLIGFVHCSPQNLEVEISPVITLPAFQRTFVSSNAVGLMLKYALDLPENGGIGFRRVVWSANPGNLASVKTAKRMGFTQEGVKRWSWVLPLGKDGGKAPVDGKRGQGQGRDSVVLSMCWDDWEGGGREHVTKVINRV